MKAIDIGNANPCPDRPQPALTFAFRRSPWFLVRRSVHIVPALIVVLRRRTDLVLLSIGLMGADTSDRFPWFFLDLRDTHSSVEGISEPFASVRCDE